MRHYRAKKIRGQGTRPCPRLLTGGMKPCYILFNLYEATCGGVNVFRIVSSRPLSSAACRLETSGMILATTFWAAGFWGTLFGFGRFPFGRFGVFGGRSKEPTAVISA